MLKKSIILTIVTIIIIFAITFLTKKREPFFSIKNLYSPSNDASVWKDKPDGSLAIAYDDKYHTAKQITSEPPSPPDCKCPKCPEAVCPTCPSEVDILRKYGCIEPIRYEHKAPIVYRDTHYQLVGYLHKIDEFSSDDRYKILPLYGKEHRGGFFKYYTQFVSGDQVFRKLVFKPLVMSNRDYSREIYEGDELDLDTPLNAKYRFKEERLGNRIDLFDEDPIL